VKPQLVRSGSSANRKLGSLLLNYGIFQKCTKGCEPFEATANGRVDDQRALEQIGGIVYFLIFQMGWNRGGPPIFGNVVKHLLPSEQARGAFLLEWLGSMIRLFVRHKDLR